MIPKVLWFRVKTLHGCILFFPLLFSSTGNREADNSSLLASPKMSLVPRRGILKPHTKARVGSGPSNYGPFKALDPSCLQNVLFNFVHGGALAKDASHRPHFC